MNVNIPVNSTEKEVKVYSGRHYNTDRSIYKKFAEETGIKVRLIEAAGISLIERLKREGKNSQADLILLVDAARITNAAKALAALVILAASTSNIKSAWEFLPSLFNLSIKEIPAASISLTLIPVSSANFL